jgi:hypothetical protein
MMKRVSVLCVAEKSAYWSLNVECYDVERDARTFNGIGPVVAHPPCGPWGRLRGMCTRQDPTLGPWCVEMVRRCGGVLEHPAWSRLWKVCGLPGPGVWSDEFGGRTVATTLSAFGGSVKKPTWLYCVGTDDPVLPGDRPATKTVEALHSATRQLTPPIMADWLVRLAATAAR